VEFKVREAIEVDLPALTGIYNHYVVNSPITFDVRPFTAEERRAWFLDHAGQPRYRLLVAEDATGVIGYATTSRWRPKPAYDTTVESTVYCRADAHGRGVGSRLYRSLFAAVESAGVEQIVAGVALPNAASVALHERLGFRQVGVFRAVGWKFDRFWDVAWYQRPVKLD
jgi:phosphinothricin acetyltransferase